MASFAFAVDVFELLTEGRAADVRALLDRATEADGVGPLSEQSRLRLSPDERGATHLVVTGPDGDGVTAYAQLDVIGSPDEPSDDEATAELVVDPHVRGRGIGTELLATARRIAPHLSVWSHGDLPAARRLAERAGLLRVRDLWQMRRALDGLDQPAATPAGITVRPFEPGRDEDAWLALNAVAFATHPEQGGWTRHDLELREQEAWFDPAGFFLAERNGRPVGFHWTKVHPPTAAEPEALGEIYVLGVDPGEAGRGLGSLLTAIGLQHLQERGLRTVLLYVEATNAAAVAVYQRAGFTRHAVDVAYRTP